MRNETCLKIIAGKLGRVLFVEKSDSYAGKTSGLRVKVLVPDYTKIPERIRLKTTDGFFREHKILITGHPNQCGRCRRFGHSAAHCLGDRKASVPPATRERNRRSIPPLRRGRSPRPQARFRGGRSPSRRDSRPRRETAPKQTRDRGEPSKSSKGRSELGVPMSRHSSRDLRRRDTPRVSPQKEMPAGTPDPQFQAHLTTPDNPARTLFGDPAQGVCASMATDYCLPPPPPGPRLASPPTLVMKGKAASPAPPRSHKVLVTPSVLDEEISSKLKESERRSEEGSSTHTPALQFGTLCTGERLPPTTPTKVRDRKNPTSKKGGKPKPTQTGSST